LLSAWERGYKYECMDDPVPPALCLGTSAPRQKREESSGSTVAETEFELFQLTCKNVAFG